MIKTILFDLGGVLVTIHGEHRLVEWTGGEFTIAELWAKWLASPNVRKYETGNCDADTFAAGIVEELNLPVTADEFKADFSTWPREYYPGARELLKELGENYQLAALSNSNDLHWPVIRDTIGIGAYINTVFVSHEMGCLKPDPEAFRYVLDRLDAAPEEIIFFDDNQVNVDGAKACGLQAELVSGINGIREALL